VGVVDGGGGGGGERVYCLLMMPKLSVGKHQHSIWMSLGTLQIPWIPFQHNSIQVIPGTIPAEFEFCSKFRRNCFINLAGPSAKFDSTGIPGIAQIPPYSGRNQWRTVKTSMVGCGGRMKEG
jgi:hypothetical protein